MIKPVQKLAMFPQPQLKQNQKLGFDLYARRQTVILSETLYLEVHQKAEEHELSIDGMLEKIIKEELKSDPNFKSAQRMAIALLKFNPSAHCRGTLRRDRDSRPQPRRDPEPINRASVSLPVTTNTIAFLLAYGYGIPLKDYLQSLVQQYFEVSLPVD